MSKKNISQAEIDSAKKEHDKKKTKRNKVLARLFYFVLAVGNIAIVAFLTIMNVDPQIGHYILSGFASVSALCFITKLIGE